MSRPDAVLWDLDGTLVDSAADIAAAVDVALAAHALRPLGEEAVRRHIGSGAAHLLSACAEEAGGAFSAELLESFSVAYRANVAVHTRLYPGIADLLSALHALGVPQAVVTNKPIGITLRLLDVLDIRDFFGAVYGGESLPTRKPDPMMVYAAMADLGVSRAVLIGDGPHDVNAAARAGIDMVGVSWGIAQPVGAPVLVHTVGALRGILEV